jgi:hypothetical protein
MLLKYPQPGELYHSRIYPGQMCKVLSVLHAQVTFEWLGQFQHVEHQRVPVNRFIRDFVLAPR